MEWCSNWDFCNVLLMRGGARIQEGVVAEGSLRGVGSFRPFSPSPPGRFALFPLRPGSFCPSRWVVSPLKMKSFTSNSWSFRPLFILFPHTYRTSYQSKSKT